MLTIADLTSISGLSNISSTISFQRAAFRLNVAPGNQAGRYFTRIALLVTRVT